MTMITINLLPETLRMKRKEFEFPLFQILFLLYFVLLAVFFVIQINIASQRQVVEEMDRTLLTVGSKSLEAQRVKEEVDRLQLVASQVVHGNLVNKWQVTMLMDAVNKNVPDGMWLTEFSYLTDDDNKLKLNIRGFVRPGAEDTMIATIGNFNTAVKDMIEKTINADLVAGQTPTTIDFDLNTKRRQAEKIEITEFSTSFILT